MIDKLFFATVGVGLIFPVFLFLLYLFRVIIDSVKNDSRFKLFLKFVGVFVLILISLFLIYFITARLIFINLKIPENLERTGIVISLIYFFMVPGMFFALGKVGHGGIPPIKILWQIYNNFIKQKK